MQILEANLHNMVVFFPSCPSFTYTAIHIFLLPHVLDVLKQEYLVTLYVL